MSSITINNEMWDELEELLESLDTSKKKETPQKRLEVPEPGELDIPPVIEEEEKNLFCTCYSPKPMLQSAGGEDFEVCAKSRGGCGKEIE